MTIGEWVREILWAPVTFLKGLRVTLLNLFRPKVTVQYPDVLPPGLRSWAETAYPRFRGLHGLTTDPETGDLYCIGCMACARICPDNLITMELVKKEGHPGRYPVKFNIDINVCCFCGLCSEVCPTPIKALVMTNEFEIATYTRGSSLVLTREMLIELGEREYRRRLEGLRQGNPLEQGNPYFTYEEEKKERLAREPRERPARVGAREEGG